MLGSVGVPFFDDALAESVHERELAAVNYDQRFVFFVAALNGIFGHNCVGEADLRSGAVRLCSGQEPVFERQGS